jgi:hypothetical protein
MGDTIGTDHGLITTS